MSATNARSGAALIWVALATAVPPAVAQQKIQLRYHPRVHATTRMVMWSAVTTTIKDFTGVPELAAAESLVVEGEATQGVTDRVEQAGPSYVVARTLDSVRARVRVAGGQWGPAPRLEVLRGLTARLTLDDRLRVSNLAIAGQNSVPADLRHTLSSLASGGAELPLPEEAVGAGDRWTADLVFPVHTGSGPAMGTIGDTTISLHAQAAVTLDSIVARGVDTLGYLRVGGAFDSLTIAHQSDSASGTVIVKGSFAGTMIWSTAWNAFVSGVFRSVTSMRMRITGPGRDVGLTMYLDIRNRLQVRA